MRRHRTSRRGLAAAALALTVGLALAACSGSSGDASSPSASASASDNSAATAADQAALAGVKVVWTDSATAPTVTLPGTPFTVTTPVIDVREPGTGDEIKQGQAMEIQLVAVSGKDSSQLQETYSTKPESVNLTADFIFHDQLAGQKVGTRFVFAVPEQSAGAGSAVIAGEVVGVRDVPTRASGAAVTPPAGLPTVTVDPATGKPTVTPVGGTPPTTLIAQPLIKGTGATVAATDTLTVQYSLYLWDGTAVESSWDTGTPATFALSGVIPGWTTGLTGQTVGSQVLLVVPPDQAYGDKASDKIPANSTLIFVVDILDAQPAA
ncbi:FKBP-type peptidyl-prolyl cis-trans isomerase [Cellulomonas sp. McL0617]|uniref:FKBP-type peptidyl-prolyl cis-trans isomerase n=1 Tax=Cellulomonas sp. McL0617 TaxID=3415675 RepID=UPI003CF838A9